MITITLTQNKVAFIDNEDFEIVASYKWSAIKTYKSFYAVSNKVINGKAKIIYMHRLILGTNNSKIKVDHKNHNTLDNRKINLRECTHSENLKNKESEINSSSKYLGVHIKNGYTTLSGEKRTYIIASICGNGKTKHLGSFKTEEEAALAYDIAAKEQYGEFANLNFK